MAQVGRPRSERPRTHSVPIRFAADELAAVRAAAEAVGKPVGVWARERLLAAARRARKR